MPHKNHSFQPKIRSVAFGSVSKQNTTHHLLNSQRFSRCTEPNRDFSCTSYSPLLHPRSPPSWGCLYRGNQTQTANKPHSRIDESGIIYRLLCALSIGCMATCRIDGGLCRQWWARRLISRPWIVTSRWNPSSTQQLRSPPRVRTYTLTTHQCE